MKRIALIAIVAISAIAATPAGAHTTTRPATAPAFTEHTDLAGWPANWTLTMQTPYCNPKVKVWALCAGGAYLTGTRPAQWQMSVCYEISTTRNGPYAAQGCQPYSGTNTGGPTAGHGVSAIFQLQPCVWSAAYADAEVLIGKTWRFKTESSPAIRSCGGVVSGT